MDPLGDLQFYHCGVVSWREGSGCILQCRVWSLFLREAAANVAVYLISMGPKGGILCSHTRIATDTVACSSCFYTT